MTATADPAVARGPVSEVLLGELKEHVRQRGVVVWLDPDRLFTAFVDRLHGAVAPVVRYRGSFVTLLRDAAQFAQDVTPTPLVVHLPGLDEATVQRTPALELAAAGYRWSPALVPVVTAAAAGRVAPDALNAFLASVTTLEEADAWLADRLADAAGGLSAVLRAMSLAEIVDQLLKPDGTLRPRVAHPSELDELWRALNRRTGLTEAWWAPLAAEGRFAANDVAYALTSWAMCVEYVHDPVARTPRESALAAIPALPAKVVQDCRALCTALRERSPEFYQRTADETEERIAIERTTDPSALGLVDTFRFEENAVLRAAIVGLDPDGDTPDSWTPVLRWAEGRADRSFWLQRDETRRMAWRLVLDAARLAQAMAAAGQTLPRDCDLPGAVAWYTQFGARVDQLHRVLEQDRGLLLKSELPEFDQLSDALDQVRDLWWHWARNTAEQWNRLCLRDGFVPEPALMQRNLFDEVVRNGDDGVTAYFVVDALRYEMADALRATFEGAGTTASLSARLAELPTVTEVGMNALAPVCAGGKLRPVVDGGAFKGFVVGEYRVNSPDTRKRAIQDRLGGATCPWMTLKEVTERDVTSLKRGIARAKLVVVHSVEIDKAGESGVGLMGFDPALRMLREAWHRLREAGVRRFVITADHGFLLLHQETTLPHGRRVDPSRRHVLSSVPADHPNEVRVPLAALGYEGASDHLMMPLGLQVFDTLKRGQVFVHGGNSLQERVIPVLVVTSKAPPGADGVRYAVKAEQRPGIAGMHRVQVTVTATGDLLFAGRQEIEVLLRAPDSEPVSIEVWVGETPAEGGVRIPVGQPTDVFFRVRGEVGGRVAIEVACAGDVDARPAPAGYFRVEGSPGQVGAPADRGLKAWLESIANTDWRQVLAHVATHGSVTEEEVVRMLGTPGKARRFGAAVDDLVPGSAPIRVRVDVVNGMKRYVREEG